VLGGHALIRTGMEEFFVTGFTAEELEVAIHMRAINVTVTGFTTVLASRDYIFSLGKVHGNGYTLIEYIAFTLEIFPACTGMVRVFNYSTVELVNIVKALF
jgi:hypothetical protein